MGDFNYPYIKWDTMYHNTSSADFVDLVLDNFLIQHVNQPTRDMNILDLVFTSEQSWDRLEVNEHISTSDYNIICWILNTKTDIDDNNVIKYNFLRANYAKITESLKDIDWEQKFQDLDAENRWNLFSDALN